MTEFITIKGNRVPVYRTGVAIVGTGAAALNAALSVIICNTPLYNLSMPYLRHYPKKIRVLQNKLRIQMRELF